jgi:FkbM family methyltransferase
MRFVIDNEVAIIEDILDEAKENDTFLDIGANMGIHSMFVDKKVRTVYSIEPHPVNLSYLVMNSNMNNSNIDIFGCGLSDAEGYLKINGPRENMEVDGSSSVNATADIEGNAVSVRLEMGDKFIQQNELENPQIVKIDTEGAEVSILRGLEDTIKNTDCRIIYIEPHGENSQKVKDIVRKYGYSTVTIGDGRIIKAKTIG